MARFVLVLTLLLSGCSAAGVAVTVDEAVPETGCGSAQFEAGERVLSCAEAIAAVEGAMGGLHWPISKARFDRSGMAPGVPCPANARCFPPTAGVVVIEFWFGDAARYHVALDENGHATAALAPPAEEEAPQPAIDGAPVH